MQRSSIIFACLLVPVLVSAGEVCLSDIPSIGNISRQCTFPNDDFENAWVGFSEVAPPCDFGLCDFVDFNYGWSISASDTDPHVNVSALPTGVVSVHIWLVCAIDDLQLAAFRVESSPDLVFLDFTAAPGFVDLSTNQDIVIAPDQCADYPLRVGSVSLFKSGPTSVESDVSATTWGHTKSYYR